MSASSDKWDETTLDKLIDLRTGKLDANAAVEGGEYPFFTCSRDIISRIDYYTYDTECVLLAGNGDFNNVLRLLEKGAPTSYVCKHRGSSAIMIASKYGHIEIIRLLIQYGADIDAQNHQGQTSLMLASKYGHKECVQLLLEKGANPNIIDNNEYLD
jgi:ankyrin repeat protein